MLMNCQKVHAMWTQFQTHGDNNVLKGNSDIIESWLRCKQAGMDPDEGGKPTFLSNDDLANRIKASQSLLEIAHPIILEAYQLASHYRMVVALLNEEGNILTVVGDINEIFQQTGVEYFPGLNCTEEVMGTNSFSLAVRSGKPARVIGPEHYCERYHHVACAAAPIKNEAGKIIGVVTVTEIEHEASYCSLGIAGIAAKAIENGIKIHLVQEQISITSRLQSKIVESISDGILTIDTNGLVTHINPTGARILRVSPRDSIGKHISELVDFEPVILQVLETGCGYTDKEFRLESKRGILHFVKTAIPLHDDYGKLIGVIDIFREIKRVRKMVNQMVGAQAVFTMDDIIGESQSIKEMRQLARLAASSEITILLEGESGTGKELLAQAIHNCSYRHEGPFVAINCGAIPRDLIESELFGYEEGAFTGAKHGGRPGKFEMAYGGTIFLDEVGEMPLEMQVKLLRVLQLSKIMRVGGTQVVPVNARIIAATNRNLWQMVQEGAFREDLYYRLNVMDIMLPSLRKRQDDIPLLIKHFQNKMAKLNGKNKAFSQEAMQILCTWHWPGNVRELENAIEHAGCLAGSGNIDVEHLPRALQRKEGKLKGLTVTTLKDAERIAIENAFNLTRGNVSQTAKLLGVGRNTLYEKIREYGIERQQPPKKEFIK